MSSHAVASEIFTMAGTLTILDIVARWSAASLACQCIPGEDPGFPIGGGTNPPGGCQHIILPNFVKNCMKLRKFWSVGGYPPKSTTVYTKKYEKPKYEISRYEKLHHITKS